MSADPMPYDLALQEAAQTWLWNAWHGRPVYDPGTQQTGVCTAVTSDGYLVVAFGGGPVAYVRPPQEATVQTGRRTARTYALGAGGTAHAIKASETRGSLDAEYVADGDALWLRLTSGPEAGRSYLVTLPTCDGCGGWFEPGDAGVVESGESAFCSDECYAEWRWGRS